MVTEHNRHDMPLVYEGTDTLARLAGALDAAIDFHCPLTLPEIRERLNTARALIFKGLHPAYEEDDHGVHGA